MKKGEKVVPVFLDLKGEKVPVGNIDISNLYGVPGGGFMIPYLEPMVEVEVGGVEYQIWLTEMTMDDVDSYHIEYYTSPPDGDGMMWNIDTDNYQFIFNPPEEILVEEK